MRNDFDFNFELNPFTLVLAIIWGVYLPIVGLLWLFGGL